MESGKKRNSKQNRQNKQKDEEEVEYVEEENEQSGEAVKKVNKLKQKLKKCQEEKEKYLKGWQKERADFINYKKEEEKKLENREIYSKEKIIGELLPILDSFEKAVENVPEEAKDTSWVEGILSIKEQIKKLLDKEGVEEIEVGEEFDPETQEAVKLVDDEEEDKVVEVLQKGYKLKEKILRPSRVKVGNRPRSS